MLAHQPYNIPVDVFSFGIMLAEITCRCSGLPQQYVMQQYVRAPKNAVIKGWRARFPLEVKKKHPMLKLLAERCWDRDASKRPTFKDIKQHLEVIGIQQSIVSGEEVMEDEEGADEEDLESLSTEKLVELARGEFDALPVEKLVEVLQHLRLVRESSVIRLRIIHKESGPFCGEEGAEITSHGSLQERRAR